MKRLILIFVVCAYAAFLSFKGLSTKTDESADKIYINGMVLTVDSVNSMAEAVAVKDGKILAVGSTASISLLKGVQTEVVDLKGKTMIPGLIDGHSHIMSSLNKARVVNIEAPPVGTVKNIADILAALRKYKKDNAVKPGEWIMARGYDPDQLMEKRHPSKEDLDKDFPDNPVMLTHASGHMSVVNSAALKVSGVSAATPDPEGGQIVRTPGTGEPTGLLLERARSVLKILTPVVSLEDKLKSLKDQQVYYASFGITTAQDGHSNYEGVELLQEAADRNELLIDIEALPDYLLIDKVMENKDMIKFGTYKNHFKMAGFKLTADGSPQGKTAFFSNPYLTAVPGCDHQCTGIPIVTQEKFNAIIAKGFKNNIHVFVHCNGDATVDMYIKAVEKANADLKTESITRRPVVIHSQFVRLDQLDKYKELGMLPALFTNHAYFWGDTHVANLGKKRAYFLSPTKTTLKKDIIFTNHTDYSVTPINQMFLLWTSVMRQSRSGEVIGPDERLTPMEGLRAITINGAYQYFEEGMKGSIEKGKMADLVVLSANPVTIDPAGIKDISVLETIKEGKTIFKRN